MKHILVIAVMMIVGVAHASVHKISDKDIIVAKKPQKLAGQTADDMKCLAYSIFREAGNQTESAKYAVGQVHINRLKEGTWGTHLCQVIFAKKQFSWTGERMIQWSQQQANAYGAMATELINGKVRVKGLAKTNVLHYYAYYVNPKWAKQGQIVAMAGAHYFVADVPH